MIAAISDGMPASQPGFVGPVGINTNSHLPFNFSPEGLLVDEGGGVEPRLQGGDAYQEVSIKSLPTSLLQVDILRKWVGMASTKKQAHRCQRSPVCSLQATILSNLWQQHQKLS